MTKLVIIESPSKIKYFRQYLGAGYEVVASFGHVRDLPASDIGIELPAFKPRYVVTDSGKKALATIRKLMVGTDEVILATDNDREGEAIAWHIAQELKLKKFTRITTNEITQEGITRAINNPQPINTPLVASQEARRVADRFVGWMISNSLSDAVGRFGLSAGRVQSPAIRLVVENHLAIKNHTPQFYFEIIAVADKFSAVMNTTAFNDPVYDKLTNRALAIDLQAITQLTVKQVENTKAQKHPAAPFITSTLQQHMSKKARWSGTQTMQHAQSLYEKGLITYIRTDAKILSDHGYHLLLAYYQAAGLTPEPKRRTWKTPDGAHEAIRPTNFANTPDVLKSADLALTEQELILYRVVWLQAVACQLLHADYANKTITLTAHSPHGPCVFTAKATQCVNQGFLTFLPAPPADDDTQDDAPRIAPTLPDMKAGQIVPVQIQLEGKSTRPPKRYDEARLTAAMEGMGIGRPSTYAEINNTLRSRDYVRLDKVGMYTPSDLAIELVAALKAHCKFIDYGFTALVESWLDKIVTGEATYLDIIKPFYEALNNDSLMLSQRKHPCPQCGRGLRRFKPAAGKSSGSKSKRTQAIAEKVRWGCSGFLNDQSCHYSCFDNDGHPAIETIVAAYPA